MARTKLQKAHRELMLSALESQMNNLINQADKNKEADLKDYYKNKITQNLEAQTALDLCKNVDIHLSFEA